MRRGNREHQGQTEEGRKKKRGKADLLRPAIAVVACLIVTALMPFLEPAARWGSEYRGSRYSSAAP